MSHGPITIFDKSALQMLSIDDAALFGQFYRAVITPLFFVETLADLTKEVADGKTPEQVVGNIAAKTANLSGGPSAHHVRLMLASLAGQHTPMDGRPHIMGARFVNNQGRRGVLFDDAPEAIALERWQRGLFLEVERGMAKDWRDSLTRQRVRRLDVNALFPNKTRPRDLAEVKAYAGHLVHERGGPAFLTALNVLRVPRAPRAAIFLRWLDLGAPPIHLFAPYAAYLTTVQYFFQLAISLDLISDARPSNAADIAYLYYLPFCQVFVSNDKLHAKTVPLFARSDQTFVLGSDLKADLRHLDQHFSALPQEILDRGAIYFDPPEGDYLTTRLWRQHLPGWHATRERGHAMDQVEEARLLAQFKAESEAPTGEPIGIDEADYVVMHYQVPVVMGKWRIIAQDVAERSWAHEAAKRGEGNKK